MSLPNTPDCLSARHMLSPGIHSKKAGTRPGNYVLNSLSS